MSASIQIPDALGSRALNFALVGPDDQRRTAVARALSGCQDGPIREFYSYPAAHDEVSKSLARDFTVVLVDLDSQPEMALDVVESIYSQGQATVMVYSAVGDTQLLVRCMRAGAREYLTLPLAPGEMAEALVRATVQRPVPVRTRKAAGKMSVFLGAKGGYGVTTIACGFAVAMAQETNESTLLIDLDLPLGDAALNLGIIPQYSTSDALQGFDRLDSRFLASLLVRHRSSLHVLAAPGRFPQTPDSNEGIDKLLAVARQEFENVIVDAGARLDLKSTALFDDASIIYLVTPTGVPELRNSNRLITEYLPSFGRKIEIVLNRYVPKSQGIDEDAITKALTRPSQWKVPPDAAAVQRLQNATDPIAEQKSPIAKEIRLMVRAACGLDEDAPREKKRFGLFRSKDS
jgi:pilus assembly protein CpaE